jgi:hypothetical protein
LKTLGSPSEALQITYLFFPFAFLTSSHFKAVLKAPPPLPFNSDARIDLLPLAMEDARKRAESISGKKAGPLKSVSMGVVQVLQPNSVDISDYGMYDTSTIEKEIMITVRASFSLR